MQTVQVTVGSSEVVIIIGEREKYRQGVKGSGSAAVAEGEAEPTGKLELVFNCECGASNPTQ